MNDTPSARSATVASGNLPDWTTADMPAPPAMGMRSWGGLDRSRHDEWPGWPSAPGSGSSVRAVASQYGGTILWAGHHQHPLSARRQPGGDALRPLLRRAGLRGISADPAGTESLDGLVPADGCQQYMALHGCHGRACRWPRLCWAICRVTGPCSCWESPSPRCDWSRCSAMPFSCWPFSP